MPTRTDVEQMCRLINTLFDTEAKLDIMLSGGQWSIGTRLNGVWADTLFSAYSISEIEVFTRGILASITIKGKNHV